MTAALVAPSDREQSIKRQGLGDQKDLGFQKAVSSADQFMLQDDPPWYRHPGSNGGPLDPQSSALTN
jgi:hypothetical protein